MLDMIEYQKPVAKRKSLACFGVFPPGTQPFGMRQMWGWGRVNKCDSSQRTRKTDSTPDPARIPGPPLSPLGALKSPARFLGKVPQVAAGELNGDGCRSAGRGERGWSREHRPIGAGRQIFCIKQQIYFAHKLCLKCRRNLPVRLSVSLGCFPSLSLSLFLFLLPRAHTIILGDNCRLLSARMIKATKCFQINFIVSPRCVPLSLSLSLCVCVICPTIMRIWENNM